MQVHDVYSSRYTDCIQRRQPFFSPRFFLSQLHFSNSSQLVCWWILVYGSVCVCLDWKGGRQEKYLSLPPHLPTPSPSFANLIVCCIVLMFCVVLFCIIIFLCCFLLRCFALCCFVLCFCRSSDLLPLIFVVCFGSKPCFVLCLVCLCF